MHNFLFPASFVILNEIKVWVDCIVNRYNYNAFPDFATCLFKVTSTPQAYVRAYSTSRLPHRYHLVLASAELVLSTPVGWGRRYFIASEPRGLVAGLVWVPLKVRILMVLKYRQPPTPFWEHHLD